MTKPCQRCGTPIVAIGNNRFCPTCAVTHKREKRAEAARRQPAEVKRVRRERYKQLHADRIRAQMATPEGKSAIARRRDRYRFGGLRQAVLERDGYKCTQCGHPWEEGSRFVVVHHLDHNTSNNTMDNLKTLCRHCHPVIHGAHSEAHKAAQSASMKRAYAEGRARGSAGRVMSAEERKMRSEAQKGHRHSPETIERMREAKRRWWAKQTRELRSWIASQRPKA